MNKNVSKDIDKKRKVFEAATRLFAQKGFDKTTVDEIAESAQVAKGTVYYYFKGKEEIFLFLVEEGIEILKTRITDALRDNQDDTRRALQQLFVVQLGFYTNTRMYAAYYWLMPGAFPPSRKSCRNF